MRKKNVMIYDYVDIHIPVFDRMYAKRLKAYKRIGYKLYTNHIQEKQDVNAIYDSDTYTSIYEKDLQEALKEIVISSQTLGKYKVMRMIRILKERQEAGVKVTLVTWHPDAYMYGREEHRIELMEELRNAGFHIVHSNVRFPHPTSILLHRLRPIPLRQSRSSRSVQKPKREESKDKRNLGFDKCFFSFLFPKLSEKTKHCKKFANQCLLTVCRTSR